MSYDPDFEKRINNKIETIIENQARFDEQMRAIIENQARFDERMGVMQEAITSLIQVARLHNGQLDDIRQQTAENRRQIAENSRLIAELREQGREQDERLSALMRIVEAHVSNHP